MPPRAAPARNEVDKNEPLVADIRLLGRILGDVIREQEGREAYELVERIRQLAVAYRHKHDKEAGKRFDPQADADGDDTDGTDGDSDDTDGTDGGDADADDSDAA